MSWESGLEKVEAYFIKCECNSQQSDHYLSDHWRGPYSSKDAVEKKVEEFRNKKKVIPKRFKNMSPMWGSTQDYIKNDEYEIIKSKGEKLPDGRIICGERIFDGFGDLEKVCDQFTRFFDLGDD